MTAYTVNDYFIKYYEKCPYKAIDVFNETKGETTFFGASALVLRELYGDYLVLDFDNHGKLANYYDTDFMVIRKAV